MQNGVPAPPVPRRPARRRGATLLELLMLLLTLVSAIAGVVAGIRLGLPYGIPAACLGGVIGLIVGVAGAVLFVILAAFASEPLERFQRYWRPYPPVCENGTCVGLRDYKCEDNLESALSSVSGLSRIAWRCRCGQLYSGGYQDGLQNRWVRVLPDGTIRPYLIHRPFGRWRPDTATVIRPGLLERSLDRIFATQLPAWTVPVLLTLIATGVATAVVYRAAGFANPIAPYFIAGCGTIGLVSGCVALRFASDRREEAE